MNKPTSTIALFGASGATGRCVVNQARARGFLVSALLRNAYPELAQDGILLKLGGFENANVVDQVIAGSRAVICVIGPRPPYTDIFCASATKAIIDSMQRVGVQRLICQTGAMIGDYDTNRSFLFKWLTRTVQRKFPAMTADRAEQELLIKQSNLSWSIVKPSRLTNGRLSGHVRAGANLKMGMMSKISRADLAGFLLDLAESNDFLRQAVFTK